MTVLQVCAYGADYPGNFIASLDALETKLKAQGIDTIYAFVAKAATTDWCRAIQKRTKVYFLPEAKARILPKTYQIFRDIYRENPIDLVHSHFELYDIPATVTAPKHTQIFWHLHDPIDPGTGLRRILWNLQYGVIGKRAKLISVSDYYRNAVISMGFPAAQTTTVLNSINLDGIHDCHSYQEKPYDFLTFGWDFHRKGDDLILRACDRLSREGYSFRLLLNGNKQTWPKLDEFLTGCEPPWLIRGEPVSDVNALFTDSKVFIQASRRETFSYAVCEAAYAGIPVICSDIAGLEWAHELPSVSFFKNEDVDGLYFLMKHYLDTRDLCSEAQILVSRSIIENQYSLTAWAQNILTCYFKSEVAKNG